MMLESLRDYDLRDYEHEVRAQRPNPVGTPERHRIKVRRFKITGASRNGAEGDTTMATKKETAAPAKETKAKKAEAPKMWGTKDVAKQLGVDPKFFRSVLRAAGKGSEGQRYEWDIGDSLKAEKRLIEDYKERQEERKANAAEKAEKDKAASKKGAKKAEKAAPKKAAKKGKKAEEEEEEEPAEGEEEMDEL